MSTEDSLQLRLLGELLTQRNLKICSNPARNSKGCVVDLFSFFHPDGLPRVIKNVTVEAENLKNSRLLENKEVI